MDTQNKETNPCAICYEVINEKNKATTCCGHSFHFTCLTTNILKGVGNHSMNCPMCRELIVDKEFEGRGVEIVDYSDSDSDSMPSLEERVEDDYGLWEGSQLWRRNLAVRDEVNIILGSGNLETLQLLGWELDGVEWDRYNTSIIKCKVVCVIYDPPEGMAPFLIKPQRESRNLLELQAYQPTQNEVIEIVHLNGDNYDDGSDTESDIQYREEENMIIDGIPFSEEEGHMFLERRDEIHKFQIYHKPIPEITALISTKIEQLNLKEKIYKLGTIKSMLHKITLDIIMEHKNNIKEDMQKLYDDQGLTYVYFHI